jgi:hypothetical protein
MDSGTARFGDSTVVDQETGELGARMSFFY